MKLIATAKSVAASLFWVAVAPVVALPYFAAVAKIIESVPGSTTEYKTTTEWLQHSIAMGYYSIPILLVTTPVIAIGAHFVKRWSQKHFGRVARWLLCATLVGWFHCASYLLFAKHIYMLLASG